MQIEKQLIAKYETERAALVVKQREIDDRLTALNGVLASLRVLTGETPKRAARSGKATGTKAIILDVLADGRPKSAKDLAELCKVTPSAIRLHLLPLVESGEVTRQGSGRSITYVIP